MFGENYDVGWFYQEMKCVVKLPHVITLPNSVNIYYLIFLFIELINDNTHKKIESEKASKDDEWDKVQVHVDVDLPVGLVVDLHWVDGIVHDVDPTLPCGNLAILLCKIL